MQVIDVPVGSGISWIREAWTLFRVQPLAWVSLTSAWFILSFLMLFVPLIGPPAMVMSQPAFFAGFVMACRDQEMGKPVVFSHLFAGFKQSGRALIQVGSVSLLATLLVLMALSSSGMFEPLIALSRDKVTPEVLYSVIDGNEAIWFAAQIAIVAIKAVLWFTSALLAHQSMPASHAIRWSFFALIGNFIPLVIFGVLMFVFLTFASLPWGLGLLVFFPIYAIAHYTSFKAIFRADADIPPPPTAI